VQVNLALQKKPFSRTWSARVTITEKDVQVNLALQKKPFSRTWSARVTITTPKYQKIYDSVLMSNIELDLENYLDQKSRLPEEGKQIIAQHDEKTIIVYQAYRPEIGHYAAKNGYFGGQFSFNRMTWIKTNFLWMMYRSGWGTKKGQEVILAIRLKKSFFNKVLSKVVLAKFDDKSYNNKTAWQKALANSPLRLQWDPDREPQGNGIKRRAIQLGLKGEIVKEYSKEAIMNIYDISEFVKCQRRLAMSQDFQKLLTPKETVYKPLPEIPF
jgi:hypothetical protein